MNFGSILGSISPAFGIASGHGAFGKLMGGGGGGGAPAPAPAAGAIPAPNITAPAPVTIPTAQPMASLPGGLPGGQPQHQGMDPQKLQGILASLQMMAPGGAQRMGGFGNAGAFANLRGKL